MSQLNAHSRKLKNASCPSNHKVINQFLFNNHSIITKNIATKTHLLNPIWKRLIMARLFIRSVTVRHPPPSPHSTSYGDPAHNDTRCYEVVTRSLSLLRVARCLITAPKFTPAANNERNLIINKMHKLYLNFCCAAPSLPEEGAVSAQRHTLKVREIYWVKRKVSSLLLFWRE